ncbi:unnamed protein product [Arabis nemorensis]|uniref:Pentatricopeptide repeat-containing protein n=1 Tax=Arabis nemorensis TaxID=586526 RepID=A0A565AM49_9BRAS|nr:unnamed protein product [Arabis nemorensis]
MSDLIKKLAFEFVTTIPQINVHRHRYSYTFPFRLKSCAKSKAFREGQQIHGHVLKLGYDVDLYVHASLSSLYAQTGRLEDAHKVFDINSHRNVVSYTALIMGYASRGYMGSARKFFDDIPVKDVVSWNAMISGYAENSNYKVALALFKEMMMMKNVRPDESTMVTVVSACAQSGSIDLGHHVHSLIDEYGFGSNLKIVNALIDLYMTISRKALRSTDKKGQQIHGHVLKLGYDVDLYIHASLSSLYAQTGRLEDAHKVFDINSHRNVVSYTTLIMGYASRGYMGSARKFFDDIPVKDVVSWNAMISGYAENSNYKVALALLKEMMMMKNVRPDESTMVTVVSACAQSGSIDLGRHLHSLIDEYGFGSNLKIVNALIDLYSKYGELETSCGLFEGLAYKDVISWNTLIGGYTHMDLYKEALSLELHSYEPDTYEVLKKHCS